MTTYRTQKAQGLNALSDCGYNTGSFTVYQTPSESMDIGDFPSNGFFCRPCPTRPRHGFVESRLVHNQNEMAALWNATLAQDKCAEMILMEFYDATHSAICTSRAIAVGLGHDGATGGKAGSMTFPLACVNFSRGLLQAAGVKTEPYLEIVSRYVELGKNAIRYVQLRDGEPIKSFGNFIPADMTVERVLSVAVDTDLLVWEKVIANVARGTVVHHPGGNMLSHFSVHASMHNIPIIFDPDAPMIGNKLSATTEAGKLDIRALRAGLNAGMTLPITRAVYTVMMGLIFFATHQASALRHTSEGCKLIGIAAALFARFGTAACLGELRHSSRRQHRRRINRDQVYEEAFKDYEIARHKLKGAWKDFFFKKWSGKYGGRLWANCTAHTIKLDRRMQDCVRDTSEEKALALMLQLNVNVNLAHNGGWWLNKFTPHSVMDKQANGDPPSVVNAAFTAYCVLTDAADIVPLAEYTGVSVPKIPAFYTGIVVSQRREIVSWSCGTKNSCECDVIASNPHIRADLIKLIEACGLKKDAKVYGGSYYKMTPVFMAALAITLPDFHALLTAEIRAAHFKLNPFTE